MGRAAARDHDRRRPGAAAHRDGAPATAARRAGFDRLDDVARIYAFAIACAEGKIGARAGQGESGDGGRG